MTTYLAQQLTEEVRSRRIGNPDRGLLLAKEGEALCDFCGNHDPLLIYTVSQLAARYRNPKLAVVFVRALLGANQGGALEGLEGANVQVLREPS